jgi:ankyrin repeat protein
MCTSLPEGVLGVLVPTVGMFHATLDDITISGEPLAMHAAAAGDFSLLEKCIAASASGCQILGESGLSLVHIACLRGHKHLFALLARNKFAPDATSLHVPSPLWFALGTCTHDSGRDITQMLARWGCDLSQTFSFTGMTPLIFACDTMQWEIARDLVSKFNININASDATGMSALTYSALRGEESVVRFLLMNGANSMQRDVTGCLPVAHAIRGAHVGAARVFVDARDETELGFDFQHTIVDTDADVTALELALSEGNTEIEKMLTNIGCRVRGSFLPRHPLKKNPPQIYTN